MIPLQYNTRNLIVRWITSLLVVVIFTLVLFILVVLLAFVEGLDALSKKTGPEGNVIILRDGATDELFSDLIIDANISQLYENQPEVLREPTTGKAMASLEVYAIATQEQEPTQEGARPTYRFLQLRGVEDPFLAGAVHNLPLHDGGQWFDNTGTQCVMGEGIAAMLKLKVGDQFYPRGRVSQPGTGQADLAWKVVGILKSRGSPFDSEIWAKCEDVGENFGKDTKPNKEKNQPGQRFYTTVVVTTRDLPTAEAFARELQDRVKMIRINTVTERKYYEELSKSNKMFEAAALFISVVFGLGAMFGLMTVMFAAVSQRIKDIGVLRILGYARWQILVSFLLESLLLALVGGGLGLLLGLAINGKEQTSFVSSGQGAGKTVVFTMIVNSTVLMYAAGFTLVMGVLGGLLPALSAMRLKVLDALR